MARKQMYFGLAVIVVLAMAGNAGAQQALSGSEITTLIAGKTLMVGTDGTAWYDASGKYEYSSRGSVFRGKWTVQGDSVCVDFDSGRKRCDQFLKEGGATYLKNANGQKYQITVK